MRSILLSLGLLVILTTAEAQTSKRESKAEMRMIIAQAICLAEAYPGSALAKDADAVVGVYQGALGGKVTAKSLEAVRDLAKNEKPSTPTPVGGFNFGLPRCIEFAKRTQVLKQLK